MTKKRIVIITSGQPSINPRLVKEADTLSEYYEVIVLYQYWNNWATDADKVLLEQKKWKAIRVGGAPDSSRFIFNTTRIIHRIARYLRDKLGPKYFLAELAIARNTLLFLRAANELKADLYIGHNPGALAIAAIIAKKRKVKCGFDAEDFHRFEYDDNPQHSDVITKKFLEEKYFPQYDYLITASPLITNEYYKYFPKLKFNTVLNVFQKFNCEVPKNNLYVYRPLRLFWFSQTIGHNRGLEDIVHAIHKCNSDLIELHILGNPREKVIARINELSLNYKFKEHQIKFYNPVPPDEVFTLARMFDVGMATEIGSPYNRDICLTNKIFTYVQSGLAIIASDTSSQVQFLKSNPGTGLIYEKGNVDSLASKIRQLFEDRTLLNRIRQHNFDLGQTTYNWSVESKKILKIINSLFNLNHA